MANSHADNLKVNRLLKKTRAADVRLVKGQIIKDSFFTM